jgi:hypothetical protein
MIEKITLIAIFGAMIYLWNRFVIPIMIKRFVQANSSNKTLKTNQDSIIRGAQGFFWAAFILISYNQLFGQ